MDLLTLGVKYSTPLCVVEYHPPRVSKSQYSMKFLVRKKRIIIAITFSFYRHWNAHFAIHATQFVDGILVNETPSITCVTKWSWNHMKKIIKTREIDIIWLTVDKNVRTNWIGLTLKVALMIVKLCFTTKDIINF